MTVMAANREGFSTLYVSTPSVTLLLMQWTYNECFCMFTFQQSLQKTASLGNHVDVF